MPRKKDKSNEQQLLLLVNMGRVIRSFPNSMKSIILQWESLFRSGEHSRHMSALPEVDIPANSPQSQTKQSSEKLKDAKTYISDSTASVSILTHSAASWKQLCSGPLLYIELRVEGLNKVKVMTRRQIPTMRMTNIHSTRKWKASRGYKSDKGDKCFLVSL